MKLAPFFAISAALHAGALLYPVSFVPQARPHLIPVTLVRLDEPTGGPGRRGAAEVDQNSTPVAQKTAKKNGSTIFSPHRSRHFIDTGERTVSTALQPAVEGNQAFAARTNKPEQEAAPQENSSPSVDAGQSDTKIALASLAGTAGNGSAGSGLGGAQGHGSGGTGRGSGDGFSQNDFRLTQARYRETPKPSYPEQARKEGQQGRVLLRVLVDQEGKSKSVEVSRSSGSQTLDRAAVEAIRLWRFSPARYGDKPVESWVRIPVDFRLTDGRGQ